MEIPTDLTGGRSLLETYLDDMSSRWKNVICVGSGNEGNRAGHTAGNLTGVREQLVELDSGFLRTGIEYTNMEELCGSISDLSDSTGWDDSRSFL